MPKNQGLLLALAAMIGSIFLYANRDWFSKRPIQISHRFHAFGGPLDPAGGVTPVFFEFDRRLKVTSVRVVPVCEILTNRFAHPLWNLISDSNSVPTKGFLYGMDVPGMRSSVKGVSAEPLNPTLKYRLLIEAGPAKAEHDFDLNPALP